MPAEVVHRTVLANICHCISTFECVSARSSTSMMRDGELHVVRDAWAIWRETREWSPGAAVQIDEILIIGPDILISA